PTCCAASATRIRRGSTATSRCSPDPRRRASPDNPPPRLPASHLARPPARRAPPVAAARIAWALRRPGEMIMDSRRRMGRCGLGVLAVLAGAALAAAPVAAGAQEPERLRTDDRDCRCVTEDGRELERCTCLVLPDPDRIDAWTGRVGGLAERMARPF